MGHAGFQCQCAKAGHIPNVTRDQAHTVRRACMKGQHKTLTDGNGEGMGCILANNLQKTTYVIDKTRKHTTHGRRSSAPDREGRFMTSHKLKLRGSRGVPMPMREGRAHPQLDTLPGTQNMACVHERATQNTIGWYRSRNGLDLGQQHIEGNLCH